MRACVSYLICMWGLNGLRNMCVLVFVNLYEADLEMPPVANTVVNGWNNDCCKWSCRILFLCKESMKTAAVTGCNTAVNESFIIAWWMFHVCKSCICYSFIYGLHKGPILYKLEVTSSEQLLQKLSLYFYFPSVWGGSIPKVLIQLIIKLTFRKTANWQNKCIFMTLNIWTLISH